jgi:hypothetical protein
MKLKPGQVVHTGRERFENEIPDDIARRLGLLKEEKPAKAEAKAEDQKK